LATIAGIDINLVLVIVELILLVPTLLLLVLGRREEKGRRHLLEQITSTAKMVSREEYFNSVRAGMQSAKQSIKGTITGSAPKTDEQEIRVKGVVDEIRAAGKRGVKLRYLLPKLHDRLTIAYRYTEAGAEIRFHPALVVSDLRYVVVDDKSTILGLPSTAGNDQPTREGYHIPSEGLSHIFAQQFESRWAEAVKYEEYLREVIAEAKSHNPNMSEKLLASQLQIPESEIPRVLRNSGNK
jgi:hypothetical protein